MDTQAPEHQEPALDQEFAVLNRELRIYQLTYRDTSEQKTDPVSGLPLSQRIDTNITRLSPGLNYVRYEVLKRSGFKPDEHRGKVIIQDPLTMDVWAAEELASITANRQALQRWRDSETRVDVIKAIDAKLDATKPN